MNIQPVATQKIALPVPIDDILRRFEQGEEIPVIAKSIGLSERTLYRRLLETQDRWKEAQQANALHRYEDAKQGHREAISRLQALKDKLDEEGITEAAERTWRLSHARAIEQASEKALARAEWELERLLKRLYGTDQQVSSSPVQINIGIARQQEHNTVTVDVQPVDNKEVLPPT